MPLTFDIALRIIEHAWNEPDRSQKSMLAALHRDREQCPINGDIIDSLDMIDITVMFEEELGIEIPDHVAQPVEPSPEEPFGAYLKRVSSLSIVGDAVDQWLREHPEQE